MEEGDDQAHKKDREQRPLPLNSNLLYEPCGPTRVSSSLHCSIVDTEPWRHMGATAAFLGVREETLGDTAPPRATSIGLS